MSRFAFARTPKWIFGHLIVLAMVVGFVNAGLWQLRRLDQRRAYNASVEQNMARPVTPIQDVLGPDATFADASKALNRRVTVTGRYLIDDEIIISGQANNSVPGVWAVSPLLLDDGRVVLVNRGWVPSTGTITKPVADARPPSGRVEVTGLISETQIAIAGESPERSAAHLSSFLRIDLARIQKQFSRKLVPAFVQRTTQRPADSGKIVPAALPVPELDDGPHLNYAMQWFGFTLMTLIGYPILLASMARDRERKGNTPDDEDIPEGAFIDEDGVIDLTGVIADGAESPS